MPYALILVILATLGGCMSTTPAQVEQGDALIPVYPEALRWLQLGEQISAMTPEEAVEQLVGVSRPQDVDQLFSYALLNQQLQTYGAWTQARDTLQILAVDESLTPEQLQIVDTLLKYNQARINWYLKYQQLAEEQTLLQEQLQAAQAETTLLEQKIQALTELETVISTRREQ
tara:strand:- start:639 stop:1157 length:519 start_codon:yes stop_codon:yes gene_type:complete